MRVSCVFFHTHVNLGGSIGRQDSLDLRSAQSKVKHFIDAMDYDPATGEVVVHTNIRCGLTQGKPGRLRIPGSNVACAIEDLAAGVVAKVKEDAKFERAGEHLAKIKEAKDAKAAQATKVEA